MVLFRHNPDVIRRVQLITWGINVVLALAAIAAIAWFAIR